MYQSKGRFSAVVCPLTAESECTRPYCQFKHAPRESGQTASDTCDLDKSFPIAAPVQLSSADRRLSGSSRDIAPDRPKTEPTVLKSHIPAIRVPQYRPTPLAILQKRSQTSSTKSATSSTARSSKPSPYTPQYVPQPVNPVVKPLVEAKFSSDEEDDNEEEILKELFQEAEPARAADENKDSQSVIGTGDEKPQKEKPEKSELRDIDHESSHSRHGHKSKKSKSASKSDHGGEHRHSSSSSSHKSSKDNHRSSAPSTPSSSSRKKDKCDKSERTSSDYSKKSSDKIITVNGSSKDEKRSKSTSSSSSKSSHKSSRSKSSSHKTEKVTSGDSSTKHRSSSSKNRESPTTGKRKKAESDSSDSEEDADTSQEHTMKGNGRVSVASEGSEEDFTVPDDVIELSDEDPEEECLRLFQEGEAAPQPPRSHMPEPPKEPSKVIEMVGTTRKRIAHDPLLKPSVVPKKIIRPSPSQQLAMRLEAQAKLQRQKSAEGPTSTVIERKRIATVSSSLIKAVVNKNNLQRLKVTTPSVGVRKAITTPPVQRVSLNIPKPHATNHVQTKGVDRVAHTTAARASVNDPAAPPRPLIPFDPKARVPANVRQTYLEKLIDANNLFCTTYEESYQKSLNEERDACQRSSDKKLYLSVVANMLFKIKKQNGEIRPATTTVQLMSHADILSGPKAKKMSFSIEKNRFRTHASVENITEEQFYNHLKAKYVMTSEQLDSMGYPRLGEGKGHAVFRSEKALSAPPDPRNGKERQCCRCQSKFLVNERGLYVKQEPCTYHWGKNWHRRVNKGNTREQQYTCCEAGSGSEGCCEADGHVFENPTLREDWGYCVTMSGKRMHWVLALDCEMVYTTRGTELARVSVVDFNMRTVFESKVKPRGDVLDYNTRFSGLTEKDLEGVETTIYDVQATLLIAITADTILMGHSLESDLKALKLVHSNVVDTSLVFPHKWGLPYKRALKNLLKEYCQKIIQDGVDGHDSAEDAKACIELMLRKVKEDLKSM